VIVNTKWNQQDATLGFDFSHQGVIFKVEFDKIVSPKDILDRLDSDLMNDISKHHLAISFDDELVKINRSLLVGNVIEEAEQQPVLFLTRYIGRNDSLSRDYVKESFGEIRFLQYERKGQPLNIASGEISVSPTYKKLIRQAAFDHLDIENDRYIYRIVYEYQDGGDISNQKIFIYYNFKTNEVVEDYIDAEWRLYSRDGFPLKVVRVDDGKEYLLSTFETKVLIGEKSTYVINDETRETKTAIYGPVTRVYKDNEFWSKDEKTILVNETFPGYQFIPEFFTYKRTIHIDPYDNGLSEQVYNSVFGYAVRRIWAYATGNKLQEDYIDLVRNSGNVVKLDGDKVKLPVYVDHEILFLQYAYIWLPIAMVIVVLGAKVYAWLYRRLAGRNNLNHMDAKQLHLLFRKSGLSNLGMKQFVNKILIQRDPIVQGPVIIGANIPGKDNPSARKNYLQYYLAGYGFDQIETNVLIELYESGKVVMKDSNINPYRKVRAPSINVHSWNKDFDLALQRNYTPALIVRELLDSQLITYADIIATFNTFQAQKVADKPAILWGYLVNHLKNKTHHDALEAIKRDDLSMIDKLLSTPSVRVLQYIISNNILTRAEIVEFANDHNTFTSFVFLLLQQRIIKPLYQFVSADTIGRFIADNGRTYLNGQTDKDVDLDTTFAWIQRAILSNPSILKELHGGKLNVLEQGTDIIHNPYPMNNATEATSLRRLVLMNFLRSLFYY
jgi:hypothetical protein